MKGRSGFVKSLRFYVGLDMGITKRKKTVSLVVVVILEKSINLPSCFVQLHE